MNTELTMNIQDAIRENAVGCLNKWPQMLVTGKPVTVEQAKDIIFRTDEFLTDPYEFSGGNARQFNQAYREQAGLTLIMETRKYDNGREYTMPDYDKLSAIKEQLGIVSTNYVTNDWASCSFIGGPHGWCHPDGTIGFSDNVGKWPSIEEIVEDWQRIATAFPYLDLHVTLMDGESCEDGTTAVINIRVLNGAVSVEKPNERVHDGVGVVTEDQLVQGFLEALRANTHSRELGLPMSWYTEFAEKVRAAVISVL